MISVCIPTYNGEKYIKEQIDSILCQLSENDEIIISDDLSEDMTLQVINSICDPRIVILDGIKFRSVVYNIENAIRHAKGDVIILADQDDVWLPGRVNQIIKALKSADLVLTNGFITDASLQKSGNTLFQVLKSEDGITKNFIKNSFVGCCMAFRSEVRRKILPFPKRLPMHDQWIGIVCKIFYRVVLIDTPSILFRRHEGNTSETGKKSGNRLFVQLKFRLRLGRAMVFLLRRLFK